MLEYFVVGCFFLCVLMAYFLGKDRGIKQAAEAEDRLRHIVRSLVHVRFVRMHTGLWTFYAGGRRWTGAEDGPSNTEEPFFDLHAQPYFKGYEAAKRAALFYFPGHTVDIGGDDPEEES